MKKIFSFLILIFFFHKCQSQECGKIENCIEWESPPSCKCLQCFNVTCPSGQVIGPDCNCTTCEPKDCSQIGVWDQQSCRCIEIVCDPAYGCENWLGFPKCQCTKCIDERCPDGSSRNLNNFCQCREIPRPCDPPRPPPPNKVWQGYPTCNFICNPLLPPCPNGRPRDVDCNCEIIPNCDPKWPPPYPANLWLPYPDCKWICIPNKCPCNKVWNPLSCKCECLKVTKCSSNQLWNSDTCQCECRESCKDCTSPQEWNETICGCNCSNKRDCGPLRFFNEKSCNCECSSLERKCCENKFWNQKSCDCECKYSCKCAPNYVWDPYTCNCVCPNKPAQCEDVNGYERYFDDGSCMCLCENAKYSRCAYGFDHEKCSCRPEFCVQNVNCIKGFEWDKYQCKCVGGNIENICVNQN